MKILIVEDSQTQAERLKYILEHNGHQVSAAINGQDALNQINDVNPNLLISDIVMPVMNGYELCKHVRLNSQFKNLPIILLTTLSNTEDIVEGLKCGANYMITKPYEDDYLLKHLNAAIDIHKIRVSEAESNDVKILVNGHVHVITAKKSQILDLLISIYDAAVQTNRELYSTRLEMQELNSILEEKVVERTDALRTSLAEKEALLKEIYHRVKNNLQVVSSLLNLQAAAIKEPAAQEILIGSSARVKSMALIHEMLYQTENLSQINMENYIDNLFKYIFAIYNVDSNKIKLSTDIDDISLSIDTAIPCGLIINELISNALKYAFPGNKSGEIKLSFKKQENNVILIVSDDGGGIPSHIDIKNSTSLGMRLIYSLTKQLDGNIVLDSSKGTTFTLIFSSDNK